MPSLLFGWAGNCVGIDVVRVPGSATMTIKDKPVLRPLLQLALVIVFLILVIAVIDFLSRLDVHHPNLAGIIVLSIFAAIFAVGWMFNRRRMP